MFELIIKTLAEDDIRDAVDWYSKISSELKQEFVDALEQKFKSLVENPVQYQKRYEEIRVIFTEKFPYGIYFTIESSTVYVHAILHTKRNPQIGISRI